MEVGESLTEPAIQRRSLNEYICRRPHIATAMALLGIASPAVAPKTSVGKKRGRCHICLRDKEQKVSNRCSKCNGFVCGAHSKSKKNRTTLEVPAAASTTSENV